MTHEKLLIYIYYLLYIKKKKTFWATLVREEHISAHYCPNTSGRTNTAGTSPICISMRYQEGYQGIFFNILHITTGLKHEVIQILLLEKVFEIKTQGQILYCDLKMSISIILQYSKTTSPTVQVVNLTGHGCELWFNCLIETCHPMAVVLLYYVCGPFHFPAT